MSFSPALRSTKPDVFTCRMVVRKWLMAAHWRVRTGNEEWILADWWLSSCSPVSTCLARRKSCVARRYSPSSIALQIYDNVCINIWITACMLSPHTVILQNGKPDTFQSLLCWICKLLLTSRPLLTVVEVKSTTACRTSTPGAKTIKKNTNSTQNKCQTHNARAYAVTSFLSTDCELSTETCSRFVYSLGPRYLVFHFEHLDRAQDYSKAMFCIVQTCPFL